MIKAFVKGEKKDLSELCRVGWFTHPLAWDGEVGHEPRRQHN